MKRARASQSALSLTPCFSKVAEGKALATQERTYSTCALLLARVAQASKPAVSQVSKPANAPNAPLPHSHAPTLPRLTAAFTLLELLIVLAIIGFLSAVALPHLKGLTRSNVMASANSQLMDDLALARRRAIASRSPVYVVFMPLVDDSFDFLRTNQVIRNQTITWQYRAYAMISGRRLGDQPGRHMTNYLSNWKSLPDGVFIASRKFIYNYSIAPNGVTKTVLPFDRGIFPYPNSEAVNRPPIFFPYIKFDEQGRLTSSTTNGTCIIPLALGSILIHPNPSNPAQIEAEPPVERAPGNSTNLNTYNHIEIDAATGRARIDRQAL